jgi:uncharacterized protein DUF4337
MTDELSELHEHAEQAHHDPFLMLASATMALLAVFVAVVGLLGHRAHTEELINQTKATDQWAYYQAKNIRRHEDEVFLDLLSVSTPQDKDVAAKAREKYAQEASRYQGEQKDLEDEAQKLEKEVALEQRRADRFDLGEVVLEVALVVTSITLLTRRKLYWGLGIALGIAGISVAASGLVLH